MDPKVKTTVLRKMTYGMWVLSADAAGDVEASTVTWVSQASFTPPLVTVGIRVGSHLHAVVDRARAFALHLIPDGQKDVAQAFIKPTEVTPTTIGGRAFTRGATGAPILDGFPCWLEARVVEGVTKGDHTVFVGEVVEAGHSDPNAAPLVLASTGWNYGG
jgi:flavin reductase (DIM6/NTAB) family NADH-FMN oxidoreductase RutF